MLANQNQRFSFDRHPREIPIGFEKHDVVERREERSSRRAQAKTIPLAIRHGVAMFWELSGDTTDPATSLLEVLHRGLAE